MQSNDLIYKKPLTVVFRYIISSSSPNGFKQVLFFRSDNDVLSESWWSCHGCLDEERSALLRIKSSFNYPSGTFLQSWGKVADCCTWEGVDCNFTTGRVVELHLSSIREEGLGDLYLNVSLFRPFQELQSLGLSGNFIVGCVENEGLSLICMLLQFQQEKKKE